MTGANFDPASPGWRGRVAKIRCCHPESGRKCCPNRCRAMVMQCSNARFAEQITTRLAQFAFRFLSGVSQCWCYLLCARSQRMRGHLP